MSNPVKITPNLNGLSDAPYKVAVVQVTSLHGNGVALMINESVISEVTYNQPQPDGSVRRKADYLQKTAMRIAEALGAELIQRCFRCSSDWKWDNIAAVLGLNARPEHVRPIERLRRMDLASLTNDDIELLDTIVADPLKHEGRVAAALGGYVLRLFEDPHLNVWADLYRRRSGQQYTICATIRESTEQGYQWLAILPD